MSCSAANWPYTHCQFHVLALKYYAWPSSLTFSLQINDRRWWQVPFFQQGTRGRRGSEEGDGKETRKWGGDEEIKEKKEEEVVDGCEFPSEVVLQISQIKNSYNKHIDNSTSHRHQQTPSLPTYLPTYPSLPHILPQPTNQPCSQLYTHTHHHVVTPPPPLPLPGMPCTR